MGHDNFMSGDLADLGVEKVEYVYVGCFCCLD